MIGVLIIPTGIGAEIGGHAGDANPVAKLMGACCDKIILHPNVVNASDINEMPENSLYVEGSLLDRFLQGKIQLQEIYQNKILVAVNKPVGNDTINAVSAGRATIGINAEIVELERPFRMVAKMKDGRATGDVYGLDELIKQISRYSFDALAIHTPIEVDRNVSLNYYRNGGINPWGGVEAKASKMVADKLNKPVAHAPVENVTPEDRELYFFNEEVDARISAEAISNCYLHCVLKGLNKAPLIGDGIKVQDVSFMVSPYGCFGTPHEACIDHNIPIIIVKENKTALNCIYPTSKKIIFVENYWDAVGIVMCMKAGVHCDTVRRPMGKTLILTGGSK